MKESVDAGDGRNSKGWWWWCCPAGCGRCQHCCYVLTCAVALLHCFLYNNPLKLGPQWREWSWVFLDKCSALHQMCMYLNLHVTNSSHLG